MQIDSHQHYWKVERGDYHWMDAASPVLHRDYLPSDLHPLLLQHSIQKTIVVQAAQTVPETEFLLELASTDDSIAGVVGWLDMESPDFACRLEQFRKHPKFVGLRPMLQDIPEDGWILNPPVLDALKLVADSDFPFEFLTYPRHLPYVLKVLDMFPSLRAVVDHISKPDMRSGRLEPWKSLIAEVAQHKNVYCKLSGMVTEADHRNWSSAKLRPYVEHVVEHFGVDRVMFGSDWPVCLQAGSYGEVITALKDILLATLDHYSEQKIFGTNAAKFYKLDFGTK